MSRQISFSPLEKCKLLISLLKIGEQHSKFILLLGKEFQMSLLETGEMKYKFVFLFSIELFGLSSMTVAMHSMAQWRNNTAAFERLLCFTLCYAIQPPGFEESHIASLLWPVFHFHKFSVSDNCRDGWILLTDTSAPGMTLGIALLVNIPQLSSDCVFPKTLLLPTVSLSVHQTLDYSAWF